MIRTILLLAALAAAPPAAAQSLLALPGPDGTAFWRTGPGEPAAVHRGVDGGQGGLCYAPGAGGRLVPDAADTSCLRYLVVGADLQTGGADPYAIRGRIVPVAGDLSLARRGFAVTGVAGIGYCGERSDCDVIHVAGVTSEAVLPALVRAVATGAVVTVRGPGVWSFESIDVVIDGIE
ncbi:hypothetical protein JQC91_17425 [Jannaschia sp. Os4]|uniref:hypothetical protein n=1 Tax=Jannaschia sp. Os4 TaxID=2807617 RepID=UPI00193A54CD|nr:hypothetical protein [Jannaschia sp. Os4]MBM2578091.1 hypothetical protein [Jannaschia sp. Os4]